MLSVINNATGLIDDTCTNSWMNINGKEVCSVSTEVTGKKNTLLGKMES